MRNKISKLFLLAVSLISGLIIGSQNVSAQTLTYENTDYYFERRDSEHHASDYLKEYKIDGKVAYCIEPRVHEGTNNYLQGNWSNINLPNEIKERVLLIAYYGYTYPNHQTIKYRAATQGMLWEAIMGEGSWVKFTTQLWGKGKELDISAERAEIERLIANHLIKPSFNGKTYNLQVGESITIHDDNGILNEYIIDVNGADYSVNGNDLTLTATKTGEVSILMERKMIYDDNYKVFYGKNIQNILVAGNVDPVVASVKITGYHTSVELHKKDSTGTIQGQASLEGAIYGVYSLDGKLITTITTDKNGDGKSTQVVPYGDYYAQEIKAPKGYELDKNKYPFDTKGKASVKVEVKEKVVENFISILKQYEIVNGNTTFLSAEQNIEFEIYYPNGKLFNKIKTDKNGYATIKIPYGVWTFHQVNTTEGFEKIHDFKITVDEKSEKNQYYNILNNSLTIYLQVHKVDSETNKTIALANTTFKILNTDTNQFISQFVGGKVYDTFKTDETGKFTTYLKIPSGNYKLVEVESPYGYLINEDGFEFHIGSDTKIEYTTYGAFTTLKYENSPIKGKIEINKVGEKFVIENGKYKYETIPLKNVKFEIRAKEDILSSDKTHLYYKKGDLVDTLMTDKNGHALSKLLPLGNYYIIETEVSDNYVLDKTAHDITLKQVDNKTPIVYSSYSKLNYLKKSTLEFTKNDLTTGNPIPNTKIEIYTEKNEKVFEGNTDPNGKITINDLPIGKYYIIETNPAEGYVITDEIVYFEIKENNEIVKAEMSNKKITSTIKIHKVDENQNPIAGVEIGIYDMNDKLIGSYISDENGDIEVELEYGNYYYQEIATTNGYILNDEKVYFSITADGEYQQYTLINEKETVEVPKTGLNESKLLNVIGIVAIITGIGYIIYEKKKK